MTAAPRFQQDRKEWATSCDKLAAQCYTEHFGIAPDDIYSLESLTEDKHGVDPAEGYEIHQILDYAGLDLLLDGGDRIITVAQRFRPNKEQRVDFNIRVENGVGGRTAEAQKWKNGHRSIGFYPDLCAFGVYDSVIDVFVEFHLIDTQALLDALASGALTGIEHPSGDGTAALYLSVPDLDRTGCIIDSWEGVY